MEPEGILTMATETAPKAPKVNKVLAAIAATFSALQKAFQAAVAEANTMYPHGNAVLTARPIFVPAPGKEAKPQSRVMLNPDGSLYVAGSGNNRETLREAAIQALAKVLHGCSGKGNFSDGSGDKKVGSLVGRPSKDDYTRAEGIYTRHFTATVEKEFDTLLAAEKVSQGATLASYTLEATTANGGKVSCAVRLPVKASETSGILLLIAFVEAVKNGATPSIRKAGLEVGANGEVIPAPVEVETPETPAETLAA